MRAWAFNVAMTVAVATVLAACGGTKDKTAGAADPAATSAAPAASQPATSAPSGAAAAEDPVQAENNPPGDIPDNLAFVRYSNKVGHYSFTHPEGWAQTASGGTVTFTDKLNGVHIEIGTQTTAPTVSSAEKTDVPALRTGQAAFELRKVSAFSVNGASGVKIVYRRNSEPDAVTGRQYRDEVERYALVKNGRELIVELYGPVGADNVDAYKTMLESLNFL
jgi:hypothetical protein